MSSVSDRIARRVPRGATTSAATTAAILGLGAVAGILTAWLLGPAGKGALALGMVWFGFLSQLGDLGVNQSITYFISMRESRAKELWGRSIVLAACQSLVAVPLGLALSRVLVHSTVALPVVAIGVLTVPFSLLLGYELSVLRGLELFGPYNTLRLTQGVLWVVSVSVCAMLSIRSAEALMWCLMGAVAITLVAATVVVIRTVGLPELGVDGIGPLLRYGLQVWIGSVANQSNANIDQLILGAFVSVAALGQYAVAVSLASALTVISAGLAVVTLPAVARAEPGSRMAIAHHNLRMGFALMVAGALVLGAAAPFLVPAILGERYRPSVPLLEILLIGQVALGSTQILHEIARGLGRLRVPAATETAGAVVTVVLLLLTVPRWGAHAAAWVSVIVYWPVTCTLWLWLFRRQGRTASGASERSGSLSPPR